jgi:hypothetical protein
MTLSTALMEAVAKKIGLTLPVTDDAIEERIITALDEAADDVRTYLNRPIAPTEETLVAAPPIITYPPEDWRAWPILADYFDHVEVVSSALRGDGYYDLVVNVGLDVENDPDLSPIRRYIVAHALNSADLSRLWRETNPDLARTVKSVSAEGQSISYSVETPSGAAPGKSGSGAPGALPTLASLDRWRRRGVFQRRGQPYPTGGLPLRGSAWGSY